VTRLGVRVKPFCYSMSLNSHTESSYGGPGRAMSPALVGVKPQAWK